MAHLDRHDQITEAKPGDTFRMGRKVEGTDRTVEVKFNLPHPSPMYARRLVVTEPDGTTTDLDW